MKGGGGIAESEGGIFTLSPCHIILPSLPPFLPPSLQCSGRSLWATGSLESTGASFTALSFLTPLRIGRR